MKYLLTELGNKKYLRLGMDELFGTCKLPEGKKLIISCQSCPDGYYPSWVSFTHGINGQLLNFVNESGISNIIINDAEFNIDVRDECEGGCNRCFCSFVEAFSFVFVEDKRFWNEKLLQSFDKSYDMSKKH